jgi:hypothetical protein
VWREIGNLPWITDYYFKDYNWGLYFAQYYSFSQECEIVKGVTRQEFHSKLEGINDVGKSYVSYELFSILFFCFNGVIFTIAKINLLVKRIHL